MWGVPDLPDIAEIRAKADEVLEPLGFKYGGSWTYLYEVDADLSLSVSLNGNRAGQSIFLGLIYKPANTLAVDVWNQLGRSWFRGRKQLYPGVPLNQTPFRSGPVMDEATWTRQRSWHFTEIPGAEAPVSVEKFAADAASIAAEFIRATPNIDAALANSRLRLRAIVELEPTVHAMIGKKQEFEDAAQFLLDHIGRITEHAKSQGKDVVSLGGPVLDFGAYFAAVRKRLFSA